MTVVIGGWPEASRTLCCIYKVCKVQEAYVSYKVYILYQHNSYLIIFNCSFIVDAFLVFLHAFVVFIVCRWIEMSRKSRHAVVNLCIAILLLCVLYTVGIRVTVPTIACRVIGISFHYLSLSVLLWITVLN